MSVRISGGVHRGRVLRTPKGVELRPTSDRVRSAVFSIIGREAVEGARVLDLFAGTGAFGIESLSRGADRSDFVEANVKLSAQIRESLKEFALTEQGRVYRAKVEKALFSLTSQYDLVFLDPPYSTKSLGAIMETLGEGSLVSKNALVVAEHRSGAELAEKYGKLALWTSRRYGDTSVSIYESGSG